MNLTNALGWTLIHFMWQGAIISVLLAGTLALLRQAGPCTRYAVSFYVGISVLVFSAVFISLAVAQTGSPITGHWTIARPVFQDHVLLTIRCCGNTNSNMNSSTPVPLAQFRGLIRAQLESSGPVARFEIVRDAGTLQLQGYLQNGGGGGTFTFSPNPNFVTEMRSLGYSGLSDETIFALTVHDISTGFVRDMNAMGIHVESAEQLLATGIHNVTVEYARELQALGYSDLSPTKLVTMRIHGISTDFIKEVEALGYSHPSIEQLVTMRIHGVTPDWARKRADRPDGKPKDSRHPELTSVSLWLLP